MSATAFQRMRRETAIKKATKEKTSINLDDMEVEELKEYAEKNNIDIGKSTSKAGILEKIKKVQCE